MFRLPRIEVQDDSKRNSATKCMRDDKTEDRDVSDRTEQLGADWAKKYAQCGNRTRVKGMGSLHSAIKLIVHFVLFPTMLQYKLNSTLIPISGS